MAQSPPTVEPLFLSALETARILGLSRTAVYGLLDSQQIESRYSGGRRLVVAESVRRFAAGLPSERD